ncbi:hypothetical protein [Candidatus Nanosynbacter sp. HMT-352]|jgi:hypothetical protein|uniref:hypothetical protein n=1 Tax=Candidatus Nanosynbacter sp. HMT-352 TaxID=2899133 RepID=UPI001E4B2C5C|nr:hypothetical protein [Candidatus Nanosynbacter sp. HMT-352]UHA57133.1 hypothetical protein LR957_02270 [Candidatus Nanosynbacter sp. HMT-352]
MDQGNQPAPQLQYNSMPMRPKKKKTGLIIGVVLGVIVLISIVSAALVYFLWWQNPEKMVTDAMSSAIMSKKMTANGKVVVDMRDQGKIELNVKTATDSGKSKANIDAKLDIKGVEKNIPLKGDAVLDSDGTIYVKINNFKDLYGTLLEMVMESSSGGNLSRSQIETYRDQTLRKMSSEIDKMGNTWMKISPDEIGSEYRCGINALKKIQSDESVRKELVQIYQKNSYFTIKDSKISDRNGGRGFELQGNNKSNSSKFEEEFKNSSVGKALSKCGKSNSYKSSESSSIDTASLKVWVDRSSHELKALELKGDSKKVSVEISFDIDVNKSEEIKIPSSAESLKEFVEGFMEGYSSGLSSTSTR